MIENKYESENILIQVAKDINHSNNSKKKLALHNWLLISILIINISSIIGFATFSLNPAILSKSELIMVIFNYSYYFFARTQIVLSFLAITTFLYSKNKFNWSREFTFVFAISLFMEWLGITYGIPFGKYEYTDLLGLKILDKVPFLIPISWFFMGIASYFMAIKFQNVMKLNNKYINGFFNILFASIFLTAWDFTLDPAMSNLTPFWVWESQGSYFGTPVVNFWGWLLTSAVIMTGFEVFNTKRLLKKDDYNWAIMFYMANLSLPIGLVIASKMFMPIILTFFTFAFIYVFVYIVSLIGLKLKKG